MLRVAVAAFFALAPLMGQAQEEELPRSQILTIDSTRLFPETLFGQSILEAIREERIAFAAENREIARAFREEELALTEQRDTLSREEFARLAEDFDARVQAAREERDAQEARLATRGEEQERAFLQQVQPVLTDIMAEAGALVLIEASTVLLRADAIDVTNIAIARIDEATRPLEPVD